MLNALSIDVEDYYQVSCFEKQVARSDWSRFPSRVRRNTHRVLDLLDKRGVRATFFVLGWVAEHHSSLVGEIAARGHEIACHSYWHRLVYELTPQEFLEDTRRAKAAIEDAAGRPIYGYRAPSYSIVAQSQWALDILLELGFRYDSSVFPIRHDRYGWQGKGRFVNAIRSAGSSTLWEFPPSTYPLFQSAIPAGGGGYMRILPYRYTRWALEYINLEEQRPACIYFHPWEVDAEQPRIACGNLVWWRHSYGLAGMERKLTRLLQDFEFAPLAELLPSATGGTGQGKSSSESETKRTEQVSVC